MSERNSAFQKTRFFLSFVIYFVSFHLTHQQRIPECSREESIEKNSTFLSDARNHECRNIESKIVHPNEQNKTGLLLVYLRNIHEKYLNGKNAEETMDANN